MLDDLRARSRTLVRSGLKRAVRAPILRDVYYSLRNVDTFEDLTFHDLMLADQVRMSNYARAIEELIPEGSVVVDVGTGSGVLACLASRKARKVYALEHSDLIERARLLASSNGITNVEFVRAHSKEFEPGEQVDVLLHEQLGMNLIDEDMITNLGDLRRRILKPGGIVLPGQFEMRVVPVTLEATTSRVPFLHEQKVHGLDFGVFADLNRTDIVDHGWDRRLIDPREVEATFAEAATLFRLDLQTDAGSVVPRRSTASFVAKRDGVLDGFVVFFTLEFSPEHWFHTGPGAPKTHWACQLYRTELRDIVAGDRLDFSLDIAHPTDPSGWRWSFDVQPGRELPVS